MKRYSFVPLIIGCPIDSALAYLVYHSSEEINWSSVISVRRGFLTDFWTIGHMPWLKPVFHCRSEMGAVHLLRRKYLLLGMSSGQCILRTDVAELVLLRICVRPVRLIRR